MVVAVAACFAAPVAAEDDTPRFESSGFLQSLDVFIAEQMAKQSAGPLASKPGTSLPELELSLRQSPKTETDQNSFFMLRDADMPEAPPLDTSLSDLPDFSSLLAPTGEMRGKDLYSANSKVNVSIGEDQEKGKRGLELSLESGYRLSFDGLPVGLENNDVANREFDLGFAARYSGFGLDAKLSQQTSIFDGDLTSFDVGLSYQANRWAARLSLSEYTEGADLYGIENEVRNMISLELGASFRLSETFGLTGGVRYYDYGDSWIVDPETGETSQMIFLGGRLKF